MMRGRVGCLSIDRMDGMVGIAAWGKLYRTALFADVFPA